MIKRKFALPTPEWIPILTGEVLLFDLLGKILYSDTNLDQNWLHQLAEEEVFSVSPFAEEQPDVQAGLELLQKWEREFRQETTAERFDSLITDYTRLFIGPGKVLAPPWESVYFNEERLVFQEQTLAVRTWYSRFGLAAVNLRKEPDDHIALELFFMAHLAKLGLAAIESQDSPGLDQALAAQRDFLVEHLYRWAPLWGDLVCQHAQTDFYPGVALLVQGALHELAAVFEIEDLENLKP